VYAQVLDGAAVVRQNLTAPTAARIAVFFCLWLGGFVGLRYIPSIGSLFTSYVAVLDIALVFIVFKGDVRVT